MLEIVALVLSTVANMLLGLIVYLKDPKSMTSRLFALLTFCFAFWAGASYFSVHPVLIDQLSWVRIVIMLAALLCLLVFLTFTTFPERHLAGNSTIRKIAISYTLFVMALSQTSLIFAYDENMNPAPNPGIIFFSILVISMLGGGIFNLLKKHRRSRGKRHDQTRFVILGLIGSFGLIFLTNFLLVVIFHNRSLISLGPAFTLIFSGAMAYAIVKHKLFDIKRTVARSVAYILSLGFIGLIYGGVIFILSFFLTSDARFDNADRVVYILLAVASAILFSPTKRFFDKLTNQIFYRDAYDPEEFLDELNSAIVGNIELGILLRQSTVIIQKNLKSEHCFVEILPTPVTQSKVIGLGSIEIDRKEGEYITHHLEKSGKKIVVTDHLGSDENKFRNLLSEKNIGVIVRLIPSNIQSKEAIAHLIIGTKKSGNVYDKQDIHTLDIVADELLIAIENALRFEEIQGFAAKLQAEVNTATSKLQKTNKKLRELDETKDEFISMASHQLRTPLTSVKGYMSMVLEGDAGKISKQQRDLLNQAFVSSQRMVYLIADLLNVSRLKTGKFIIESTPTNLAEVIEGEIDQLKETAKAKKIDIEYVKPKDFPTLALDETKIRQVIMNFSDNAIYYTPRGGKIKVELSEDKSYIYFKVTDNGLGIPKRDMPHMFTKFYRASNARKARPDGTGLGLFMAKKVIDAQGGSILFESEENKGSMFGFCFDKKKHKVKKHIS